MKKKKSAASMITGRTPEDPGCVDEKLRLAIAAARDAFDKIYSARAEV